MRDSSNRLYTNLITILRVFIRYVVENGIHFVVRRWCWTTHPHAKTCNDDDDDISICTITPLMSRRLLIRALTFTQTYMKRQIHHESNISFPCPPAMSSTYDKLSTNSKCLVRCVRTSQILIHALICRRKREINLFPRFVMKCLIIVSPSSWWIYHLDERPLWHCFTPHTLYIATTAEEEMMLRFTHHTKRMFVLFHGDSKFPLILASVPYIQHCMYSRDAGCS